MQYTTTDIGKLVRDTRKALGVSQHDLALTSGTGQRFISELENGKATCQLGKALVVLQTLGIKLQLKSPVELEAFSGDGSGSGAGAGHGDGSGEG
jgi:HTH-type transcriptional regulator / antitoxin HipB